MTFWQDHEVELRVQITLRRDLFDEGQNIRRQLRFAGEDVEHLEHEFVAAFGKVAQEIEDTLVFEAERTDERDVELLESFPSKGRHPAVLLK